jgi:hypothetical protein
MNDERLTNWLIALVGALFLALLFSGSLGD